MDDYFIYAASEVFASLAWVYTAIPCGCPDRIISLAAKSAIVRGNFRIR